MLGNRPLLILMVPSLITSAFPLFLASSTKRVAAGIPKANVFPVPVRDRPMTSRPANTGRIALAWTGVKWVIPLWDNTSIISWDMPHCVQCGLEVERNRGLVKLSSS